MSMFPAAAPSAEAAQAVMKLSGAPQPNAQPLLILSCTPVILYHSQHHLIYFYYFSIAEAE